MFGLSPQRRRLLRRCHGGGQGGLLLLQLAAGALLHQRGEFCGRSPAFHRRQRRAGDFGQALARLVERLTAALDIGLGERQPLMLAFDSHRGAIAPALQFAIIRLLLKSLFRFLQLLLGLLELSTNPLRLLFRTGRRLAEAILMAAGGAGERVPRLSLQVLHIALLAALQVIFESCGRILSQRPQQRFALLERLHGLLKLIMQLLSAALQSGEQFLFSRLGRRRGIGRCLQVLRRFGQLLLDLLRLLGEFLGQVPQSPGRLFGGVQHRSLDSSGAVQGGADRLFQFALLRQPTRVLTF